MFLVRNQERKDLKEKIKDKENRSTYVAKNNYQKSIGNSRQYYW